MLRLYLQTTPVEQLMREWEAVDQSGFQGPTLTELLALATPHAHQQKETEK